MPSPAAGASHQPSSNRKIPASRAGDARTCTALAGASGIIPADRSERPPTSAVWQPWTRVCQPKEAAV